MAKEKKEKKPKSKARKIIEWVLTGLFLVLFAIAGILCAVAGLAEATMTSIIAAVFALVARIIGLFIVKKKDA